MKIGQIIKNIYEFAVSLLVEKEHPIIDTHTMEIAITNGTTKYELKQANVLNDTMILGVSMRPQNNAASAANGGTRCSKTGKILINNALAGCGHITFVEKGGNTLDDFPLEYLMHDYSLGHTPGSYAQVIASQDFDPQASYIDFSSDANLTVGECIEITFYYVNDRCGNIFSK